MHISVDDLRDKNSIHYGVRYDVFLDGKLLEHCYEANEEGGWAKCLEIRRDWTVAGIKSRSETVNKWGKVEIRRREEGDSDEEMC